MHQQCESLGALGLEEAGEADEPPDFYHKSGNLDKNAFFGKLRADSGYGSLESLLSLDEEGLDRDEYSSNFERTLELEEIKRKYLATGDDVYSEKCERSLDDINKEYFTDDEDDYSSKCERDLDKINKNYFASTEHLDESCTSLSQLEKVQAHDASVERRSRSDSAYGSLESLLSTTSINDASEGVMSSKSPIEDSITDEDHAVSVSKSHCEDCGSPIFLSDVHFELWEPNQKAKVSVKRKASLKKKISFKKSKPQPRRKVSLPDRRGAHLEPLYIKRVVKVKIATGCCGCEHKINEADGAVGGEPNEAEKGVMFERVADQLAAIADNYELMSPHSPDDGEAANFAVRCIASVTPSLEGALGLMLRDKGDQMASELGDQITPIVSQMVRDASYNSFRDVMADNLGREPSWQQLALMFRLTKAAVALVGKGTEKALSIKDMTLQYFEDQFAGWVVTQGGWESMVEDTDLSSELD